MPPGTEALGRIFAAAGGPVLILFDEVLNFLNRHRAMADSFLAFIQNLTGAMTGITHGAAVISLPCSQVEMTDWDMEWATVFASTSPQPPNLWRGTGRHRGRNVPAGYALH